MGARKMHGITREVSYLFRTYTHTAYTRVCKSNESNSRVNIGAMTNKSKQ